MHEFMHTCIVILRRQLMKMQKKDVHIIGIQMDLGASKRGMNMGPLAIRYADLLDKLEGMGYSTVDKGDILSGEPHTDDPKMKNFHPIFHANQALFFKTIDSLNENALPIILGGDHCVSAGSIAASAHHFNKVGVIWIDAHGDFNDKESSPTGNMHGMPLSAVCGFGPNEMVAFGLENKFVDPRNVALVGGRDIDELERQRLAKSGVTMFSIHEVDKLGMVEVMSRAIAIASKGTDGIHVSFDVDAITPDEAPGVGTPVHRGLTVRESFLAAEMIAESGKLLAIDMVEVNPILDVRNKTGILACELILSLLGKTVF